MTEIAGESDLRWMNYIATVVWPYARKAVLKRFLKEMESRILVALNKRKELSVTEFSMVIDLGNKPPSLSDIKPHRRTQDGAEALQIDVDVHFQSGPDFIISPSLKGAGPGGIPIDVQGAACASFELGGRLSLVLSPLIPQPPFFGAHQIYFCDTPVVRLKFVGFDRCGSFIANIFHNVIENEIQSWLRDNVVLPHRLVNAVRRDLSLETFISTKSPLPLGVLEVEILDAESLIASDTRITGNTSDPFVKVRLGNCRMRTSTLASTTNPKWNDGCDYLPVYSMAQCVCIEVFDDDVLTANDLIGWVEPIPVYWLCHAMEQEAATANDGLLLDLLHPDDKNSQSGTDRDRRAGRLRLSVRFLAPLSSTIADRVLAKVACAASCEEICPRGPCMDLHPACMDTVRENGSGESDSSAAGLDTGAALLRRVGGVEHATCEPYLVSVKLFGIEGGDSSSIREPRCKVSIESDHAPSIQYVASSEESRSSTELGEQDKGIILGTGSVSIANRIFGAMKKKAKTGSTALKSKADFLRRKSRLTHGGQKFGMPSTQESKKGQVWAKKLEARDGLKVAASTARAISHFHHREGWDVKRIADMFGMDVEAVKTCASMRWNFEVVWHEAFHFVTRSGKSPYGSKIQIEVVVPPHKQEDVADVSGFIGSCTVDLARVVAGDAKGVIVGPSLAEGSSVSATVKAQPLWCCQVKLPLLRSASRTGFAQLFRFSSAEESQIDTDVQSSQSPHHPVIESDAFAESGIIIEFVVEIRSLHHARADVLLDDDEPPPKTNDVTKAPRHEGVKVEFA
eukprot:TRINITY_DN30335_c0_g1_i1.p1 TRINITY_DN30335_c0_g1~~TRINITY_DN30335_c0_g1_i1.p1  ORF type:complete len:797 (-),score=100.07 TRINITY_DN30335_c0_g1_i1:58-2448(-)